MTSTEKHRRTKMSFRCRVLDWHRPSNKQGFDGASFTARCVRCGKRILQDSQGNWFAASYQDDDR